MSQFIWGGMNAACHLSHKPGFTSRHVFSHTSMSTQRGVVRTFHVRCPASSHPSASSPLTSTIAKNRRQEWHLIKTQFVPFIKFHPG